MPFARQTLTQLKASISASINAKLQGADALLRFSNLRIIGVTLANLVNAMYGYLDWIAKQAVPFTATGEFLEAWAALIGVVREPATSAGGPTLATGAITFTGENGTIFPANTLLSRGDGVQFVTGAAVEVVNNIAVVSAVAVADPTGQTGAFGNCPIGTVMTLGNALDGIQSTGTVTTAFTGGADLELDSSLRSRMLFQFQNPPQGGSRNDYVEWATDVPGVTRAWCSPNIAGPGTVTVFVMLDQVESGYGGFPQGTNGVAATEPRAVAATGDQLNVANAIIPKQPVTALVYVVAPTPNSVPFVIANVPAGAQPLVAPTIAGVFLNSASPGGAVPIQSIWTAIASISGVPDMRIIAPTTDITCGLGQLPTVGAITFQ